MSDHKARYGTRAYATDLKAYLIAGRMYVAIIACEDSNGDLQ
jgi:hypothetical protein